MARRGGIPAKRRRDPEARFEAQRARQAEKRRLRAEAERDLRDIARQQAAGDAQAGEEAAGGT